MLEADVLQRVGDVLTDPHGVRFTTNELHEWILDAQREIIAQKPEESASIVSVKLQEGVEQNIPNDCFKILDVVCNQTGEPITIVARHLLDTQLPGWRASRPKDIIQHVVIDPASPRRFQVYPPAGEEAEIQIVCAMLPNNQIILSEIWLPAVTHYCLFKCYSKDAEFAGNANIATLYYQAFHGQVNGMKGIDSQIDMNLANLPRNPNVPMTLTR